MATTRDSLTAAWDCPWLRAPIDGWGEGEGSGWGTGRGDGDGDGSGTGTGWGSGWGWGRGEGWCEGDGSGPGSGSGSGPGTGIGDGDGEGWGWGWGTGWGVGWGEGAASASTRAMAGIININQAAQAATGESMAIGEFVANVGDKVLIRDHMHGVYVGELAYLDPAAGVWQLTDARQIHYWDRAAATSGVAVHGPGGEGSRVGPVCLRQSGRALVGIISLGDDTHARLMVWPEWRP